MYVTGDASPAERAQVEQWRAVYPEVDAELKNIEAAMEAYAIAHAVSPSAGVKDRLMASLDTNPVIQQPAKIISVSSWWKTAAAAAVILLLVSSAFNYIFYNKYQNAEKANKEAQSQLASMQNDMGDMKNDMNIIQSKYSEPVALKGMEKTPDAEAKIYWMKNTGEVYVDPANMPMAPKGMQYQLWAIVDGKPVDAGMISSKDGKKYSIQKMKTFGKAQAFAITLETEGGHEQPKGTMYVMGTI